MIYPIGEYQRINLFYDGFAAVQKNGKWGYIDKTGKIIIPLEYDNANPFSEDSYLTSEDIAAVQKNGKWGYIDKTGKIIIPLEHDQVNGFHEGFVWLKKDGKCGYMDKKGNLVVPFVYDSVYNISESLVWIQNDGKYGILEILYVGDPIGDVLYSDITAYINDNTIPTSVINGKTLVVAEDLANYGFNVKWDGTNRELKVEQNKNKKITPLSVEKDTTHKLGTIKEKYLYTDIKTYLSGEVVESYAIDGRTLIDFELLAKYGKISWDEKSRELRLIIK